VGYLNVSCIFLSYYNGVQMYFKQCRYVSLPIGKVVLHLPLFFIEIVRFLGRPENEISQYLTLATAKDYVFGYGYGKH